VIPRPDRSTFGNGETRRADKGLPTYQDSEESDVFILSGAEDLVPVLVDVDGEMGCFATEQTGCSRSSISPMNWVLRTIVLGWQDSPSAYRCCDITTSSHLDHTVFEVSLIDGGRVSMATEVPLAYQDILFLDELTESPCNVLGVLRQPLEVERVAHALIRPVEQSPGVRSTIHEVITSSDQKPSSLKGLYDADKGMVLFSLAE
jgi:hypothetical protein